MFGHDDSCVSLVFVDDSSLNVGVFSKEDDEYIVADEYDSNDEHDDFEDDDDDEDEDDEDEEKVEELSEYILWFYGISSATLKRCLGLT